MDWLVGPALFLATVLGMEGVAYAVHRWVMHGPGWVLHESHHRPRTGPPLQQGLGAIVGHGALVAGSRHGGGGTKGAMLWRPGPSEDRGHRFSTRAVSWLTPSGGEAPTIMPSGACAGLTSLKSSPARC